MVAENGEFKGATKAQLDMVFDMLKEVREDVKNLRTNLEQRLIEYDRRLDEIQSWRMKIVGASVAIAAIVGTVVGVLIKKFGG